MLFQNIVLNKQKLQLDVYSLLDHMANHVYKNVGSRITARHLSKVLCGNDEEADSEAREDEDGDEVHDAGDVLANDAQPVASDAQLVASDAQLCSCQVESSCCFSAE